VEERGPERDLVDEGFYRPLDHSRVVVEHGRKMRPNNLRHQHVVLSVHTLHSEMVRESEDVVRSGMCPRLGRKVMMNLHLVVPASEVSHGEVEGDVSAVWRDC